MKAKAVYPRFIGDLLRTSQGVMYGVDERYWTWDDYRGPHLHSRLVARLYGPVAYVHPCTATALRKLTRDLARAQAGVPR